MNLTFAQRQTLKSDILNSTDPAVIAAREPVNEEELANIYNASASPAFWGWKTSVTRLELYYTTSDLPSDWDFSIYKAQAVAEQGAWREMFMGDTMDFSKPNVRSGIGKIFGAANAQTLHCLAVGRRLATRVEKLFAIGVGSKASPAVFVVEGTLTAQNVADALGNL